MDCEPREAEGGAVGGGCQGCCVSSMLSAQIEHHEAGTGIHPCGTGWAFLSWGGAWILCLKWAKQHLLCPNSSQGSSIREGINREEGENPQQTEIKCYLPWTSQMRLSLWCTLDIQVRWTLSSCCYPDPYTFLKNRKRKESPNHTKP